MSSIQAAKLGMGYQTATQRPSCSTCKHVGEHTEELGIYPYSKSSWSCKKAGFKTTVMAVCREHEPKLGHQPSPG